MAEVQLRFPGPDSPSAHPTLGCLLSETIFFLILMTMCAHSQEPIQVHEPAAQWSTEGWWSLKRCIEKLSKYKNSAHKALSFQGEAV